MNSAKLELAFRQHLISQMKGFWDCFINRENNLNPGVPDLTYLMKDPSCEVGFLELKAVEFEWGIQIEPSQHGWMRTFAARTPAHFLVQVRNMVYLVPGERHDLLGNNIEEIAQWAFEIRTLRSVLPRILTDVSRRSLRVKSDLQQTVPNS